MKRTRSLGRRVAIERLGRWGPILWLLVGCATSIPLPPISYQPFPDASAPQEFRLQPGDTVEVLFEYWPELTGTQQIRLDGNISVPFLGDIQAAGRTPGELDGFLTEQYESTLRDPEITVIVRDIAGQMVYVGGEVKTPRILPLTPQMTVLDALIAAGGPLAKSAHTENVLVIRNVEGKRYATTINLVEMLQRPDPEAFFLRARDIVFVPRTRIDRMNQWVDQYIVKMIPDVPLLFYHDLNSRTTIGISQ
jgi:protein involved in polysaccharide export with SLBB domain